MGTVLWCFHKHGVCEACVVRKQDFEDVFLEFVGPSFRKGRSRRVRLRIVNCVKASLPFHSGRNHLLTEESLSPWTQEPNRDEYELCSPRESSASYRQWYHTRLALVLGILCLGGSCVLILFRSYSKRSSKRLC